MALLKTSCWGDISLGAYQQSQDSSIVKHAHKTANFPKNQKGQGEVPWIDTLLRTESDSGTSLLVQTDLEILRKLCDYTGCQCMIALDDLRYAFRNVRIRYFFRPFWRAPSERAYNVRSYLGVCFDECPKESQHRVKCGAGSKWGVRDGINIPQNFTLDFGEGGLRGELQEQRKE